MKGAPRTPANSYGTHPDNPCRLMHPHAPSSFCDGSVWPPSAPPGSGLREAVRADWTMEKRLDAIEQEYLAKDEPLGEDVFRTALVAAYRAGAEAPPKPGPAGVRVTGEADTPYGRLPILSFDAPSPPAETAPRPPGYGSPNDACADLEGTAEIAEADTPEVRNLLAAAVRHMHAAAPEVDLAGETKCTKHGALVCEECARDEGWRAAIEEAARLAEEPADWLPTPYQKRLARQIRALTPAVPGAADEEG